MTGSHLPIPSSTQLRSFGSFCLLAITAMLLQFVLRFDAQVQALAGQPAGDLAAVKMTGFALLLGVVVMLALAWFSALFRVQAAEARLTRVRMTTKRGG